MGFKEYLRNCSATTLAEADCVDREMKTVTKVRQIDMMYYRELLSPYLGMMVFCALVLIIECSSEWINNSFRHPRIILLQSE